MDLTPQTPLRDVLAAHPGTARIFREFGMRCLGCSHAAWESVEDACAGHGVNVDELMHQLWEYLADEEPA